MSITSANAVIMLAVVGLFDAPQQLQGFAADDIFTTEDVPVTEVVMGVDGKLSAGFVNAPTPQTFALQADSNSNAIFEQWAQQMKIAQDVYYANASIWLPSVFRKFTCTKGSLMRLKPMPDAARILQPRRFQVTWESVLPAPV